MYYERSVTGFCNPLGLDPSKGCQDWQRCFEVWPVALSQSARQPKNTPAVLLLPAIIYVRLLKQQLPLSNSRGVSTTAGMFLRFDVCTRKGRACLHENCSTKAQMWPSPENDQPHLPCSCCCLVPPPLLPQASPPVGTVHEKVNQKEHEKGDKIRRNITC